MDNLSPEQRKKAMHGVKSENTTPEVFVRHLLRAMGYVGYRLHWAKLPGKPDIVFIKKKKAIFVHGCFWHAHDCRRGSRIPKTNRLYWKKKIKRNQLRDLDTIKQLHALDWDVLVVWECDIADPDSLKENLRTFLHL